MNRSRWIAPGRLALTVAVGAGLATLATLSPVTEAAPSTSEASPTTTLQPVAATALSCPGPELSGVEGVDDIDVPARVGAATAPDADLAPVRPSGPGQLVVRSGDSTSAPVAARGVATTAPTQPGRSSDVLATGSLAPGLAAAQEWSVARADLRGLATVPCAAPGSDLWLLAGGGAPGRQERLVLTNPGANEVTVDVQAFGRKGVIPAPTGGTVVPARGRTVLLVDAITGAEESPAVRVRATGGAVRAVMSDVWLDGSVPAGAETSVPTAAPSRRQIIPAAIMTAGGSIRIAVPDPQQAVVSARILGKDGPVPVPGGGVTRVPGRSTGELALTGLAEGTYAVELTSDVPIVASLWASWREGEASGDFVWAPSTPAAAGLLGGAFPASDTERVGIANVVATGGPARVTVTWQAQGRWTTRTVNLAQDTSATFDLSANVQSVWVRRLAGTGEIRAGVGSLMGQSGRLVSVLPLIDSTVSSTVSRAYPTP